MKNELKKSLLLSALSFSTSLKLQLDDNENYIVKGANFELSLNGNLDTAMIEIFQYIFANELNLPLSITKDEDYYTVYLQIVSNNIDKLSKDKIIKEGIVFDGIFSQENELILATTLTLAMLDNIPDNPHKVESILNAN